MSTILAVPRRLASAATSTPRDEAGRPGRSSGAKIPLVRGTATHDDAIEPAGGLCGGRTVRRVAGSPAASATGSTAAWVTGRAAAGGPEPRLACQPREPG